jgi:hypothetical protein
MKQSTWLTSRFAAVLGLTMSALIVNGCAHRDATRDINAGVAPFTQTRDHAVALVNTAKRALGASDLNQLAVAYGALERSANAYSRFLVQVAGVTSFDAAENAKYAANLNDAIGVFNRAFVPLRSAKQGTATVPSAWIPSFAESIEPNWTRYHSTVAAASPEARTALMNQLTNDTRWPNFEDIATESLSASDSH